MKTNFDGWEIDLYEQNCSRGQKPVQHQTIRKIISQVYSVYLWNLLGSMGLRLLSSESSVKMVDQIHVVYFSQSLLRRSVFSQSDASQRPRRFLLYQPFQWSKGNWARQKNDPTGGGEGSPLTHEFRSCSSIHDWVLWPGSSRSVTLFPLSHNASSTCEEEQSAKITEQSEIKKITYLSYSAGQAEWHYMKQNAWVPLTKCHKLEHFTTSDKSCDQE